MASGFRAHAGSFCLLPDEAGKVAEVLLVIDPDEPIWSFAALPSALPAGTYRLDHGLKAAAASRAALGWCPGSTAFTRYKATERNFPRLGWPKAADACEIGRAAGRGTVGTYGEISG